jgi:hypothetical protein
MVGVCLFSETVSPNFSNKQGFLYMRGSIRAIMHKVVIPKKRILLTRSYLKNSTFLIPPNRLKCGIMIVLDAGSGEGRAL